MKYLVIVMAALICALTTIDAVHVFDTYRAVQYDNDGEPYGSRKVRVDYLAIAVPNKSAKIEVMVDEPLPLQIPRSKTPAVGESEMKKFCTKLDKKFYQYGYSAEAVGERIYRSLPGYTAEVMRYRYPDKSLDFGPGILSDARPCQNGHFKNVSQIFEVEVRARQDNKQRLLQEIMDELHPNRAKYIILLVICACLGLWLAVGGFHVIQLFCFAFFEVLTGNNGYLISKEGKYNA